MKEIHSATKIFQVLGDPVTSDEMSYYGLPCVNSTGIIAEHYQKGLVNLMHKAVERFYPEIHVVTFLKCRNILNRFEEADVRYYKLFRGNANPNIEFIFDEASRAQALNGIKILNQALKDLYYFSLQISEN